MVATLSSTSSSSGTVRIKMNSSSNPIQHELEVVEGKILSRNTTCNQVTYGIERKRNNNNNNHQLDDERSMPGTSPLYGIDDLAALSPTPATTTASTTTTTTTTATTNNNNNINSHTAMGGTAVSSNVANDETIALLLQHLSSHDSTEDTIEDSLLKLAHICTDTVHPISCQHHRQCLFRYRGQSLIVDVMRRFIHRAMVQYAGCRALTCSISAMAPAVKEHVAIDNRAFDVTITALDRHPRNAMVHISGCHFLANVISSMVISPDLTDFMSSIGINQVVASMRQFPKHMEMQRVGCLFFYNISCHYDTSMINEIQIISVMEVLLVAMLEFPKSRSMHCLGCRALIKVRQSHLIINQHQDLAQSYSIDKSIRNAITSAINEFPNDPRIRQLENLLNIITMQTQTSSSSASLSLSSSKNNFPEHQYNHMDLNNYH